MEYFRAYSLLLTAEQEIKALKVKCNNDENGCGWTGELRCLDNHLTTCGYTLFRCTNKCTNNTDFDLFPEEVYVLRRDMDNHLENTCPNRQYQCLHCKDTGRHCEITTTHLDTCPKLKIPCPNVGCDDSVPRCELSDHQTKCLFEKVPCKYAGIGCEEEPFRKDLQQHEDDYMLHLQLAVETVNKQQKEMKAMKNELREIKQRAIEDSIVYAHASRCVFRMPNFNQQKTQDQEWYSPPFYTYPGGYKMCISVCANGDDDVDDDDEDEGTHVAVYVYLMRGKNDDNLSWPFRGVVTITLLNQLEDKNHHIRTVTYPERKEDGTNMRVVESERATGYGNRQFISHDRLAQPNYQYLKDDCLYFRITAKRSWLTYTT